MLFYRNKKRHHNIKNTLYCSQQSGFSLIELMITIPLGLLIMLAVLKIFTANIQGVNMQNAFSRVQENGRVSMELMTRDIRVADYWGCGSLTKNGVSGENNVSSTTIGGISVKDNTDTLTLQGTKEFSNAKILSAMASTSADIYFTAGSGIQNGDTLVVTNCDKTDEFINTSTIDGTISHSAALSGIYDTSAQLLVTYSKKYFIGKKASASVYSLYRLDDGATDASEMVRGVNNLQLTYGEDTDGDGSANKYAIASSVNMNNVVSIRLRLSCDNGSGTSGESLDRVYTVTANVRNRSLK